MSKGSSDLIPQPADGGHRQPDEPALLRLQRRRQALDPFPGQGLRRRLADRLQGDAAGLGRRVGVDERRPDQVADLGRPSPASRAGGPARSRSSSVRVFDRELLAEATAPSTRPTRDDGPRPTPRPRGWPGRASDELGQDRHERRPAEPSIWSSAIIAARRTIGRLSLGGRDRGRSRVVDLDQGVDQRVLERSVGGPLQGFGDVRRGPVRPIRPSASAAARRSAADSTVEQRGAGRRPTPRSRQSPAEWVAAWRTVSSGSSSATRLAARAARPLDPRERPDGLAAGLGHGAVAEHGRQRPDCDGPLASDRLRRPAADGRAPIGESLHEVVQRRLLPVEPQPARVVHLRRTGLPDAVDRPQHVRLPELRGRAAELVPAAGVDHEQAAVGVLDHVGRVEVVVVARRGSPSRCVVKVDPSGVRTCRRHLLQVEHGRRRGCRR